MEHVSGMLKAIDYTSWHCPLGDGYYRPSNLNYILVEDDANQFYNPNLQKIKIDEGNEYIAIKYAPVKAASSYLNRFSFARSGDDCVLYVEAPFGSCYAEKKIREPKAGDLLYAYEPATGKEYVSAIVKVGAVNGRCMITVSSGSLTDKFTSMANPMRFYVALGDSDKTLFKMSSKSEYYYEPAKSALSSESTGDIYIGFDSIVGFDFDKTWR